jgi:zinc protease
VSALNVAEIEAAAQTILTPENMIWMVVGDRESIEPALRALNIGEIVAVEA